MVLTQPWAKLERVPVGETPRLWLSLVDHSADVAAVFEAILAVPLVEQRLARLAGVDTLSDVQRQRLCVHVALHDFGKANRGFQRQDATNRGHVGPGLALIYGDSPHSERLMDHLPFQIMDGWGAFEAALRATGAHHGCPISQAAIETSFTSVVNVHWRKEPNSYDPIAALASLEAAVLAWFPLAFSDSSDQLPTTPPFWHAYAGFVMLADWIGSDSTSFPLVPLNAPPTDRMGRARALAPDILQAYGFDPAPKRRAMPAVSFSRISPFEPREIQKAVGEAIGQIVALEAETGSGKTEAALFRFARLFEAGEVDGLYFALPTRVAAKSLYDRVRKAVELLFPDSANRPSTVLAVPGYARVDGITARPLPGFKVQWDDDPIDGDKRARWAAERPKRFLAGTIAVGTIDQALLGGIQVRHAHMRSACLLRHLLVVDEVHSSDIYMERLLTNLLRQHTRAGGHALLLSATLGAAARQRLLGRTEPPPNLPDAIAQDYPAVATTEAPKPQKHTGSTRTKNVMIRLDPNIADAGYVAQLALEAAKQGAKVLVVRNLHRTAVATAEALVSAAPDHPALFRCNGVPTLHHGRFSREDRELLDGVIETQMRDGRGSKGLVLIGTQTLEQSLDICADLLITDLAPSDVLLQRIGRLHRHDGNKRPAGFDVPCAVILSPSDLTPLLARGNFGLGGLHGPYRDLVTLEATRGLISKHPLWRIPAMNRMLVEMVMHPDARDALTEELEKAAPGWRQNRQDLDGHGLADVKMAHDAALGWGDAFERLAFPDDEKLGTRLGAEDLSVTLPPSTRGPFAADIAKISIPSFWRGSINASEDISPTVTKADDGSLVIRVQNETFGYNAFGLHRRIA